MSYFSSYLKQTDDSVYHRKMRVSCQLGCKTIKNCVPHFFTQVSIFFLLQVNFRTGSSVRTAGGSIVNAKQFHLHPQFDRDSLSYDVAIVETAQPLPIKEFATLPPPGYNLITSTKVDAVGWGNTEEGMLSKELRTVRIPVISAAKCRRAWGQYYTDTSLCAGRLNKDSCSGDSGESKSQR